MGWQLFKHSLKRKGDFSFLCSAVSHIGNYRENQEDNFFIGEMITPREQALLSQSGEKIIRKDFFADSGKNRIYAVSDGMGGHEGGEVASCMVVDALRQFADLETGKAFHRRQDKFAYIENFQKMIRQTNLQMLRRDQGKSETACMGATLSGLILFADEAVSFHIGDSAAYLFENDILQKLTVDDTEMECFGKTRRLTKYFGLSEGSGILTAAISAPIVLRAGQIFLIASDGLTDSLRSEEIAGIIKERREDIGKAADVLIESALVAQNGGRDNITAVVLKIQNQ